MLEIKSDLSTPYCPNSKIFNIKTGKKYKVSTEIRGFNGKPYSAYFGVVFLDENGKEKDRKIHWISDFSALKNRINLVFEAITNRLVIIYRINKETPVNSPCELMVLPLNEITISSVGSDVEENCKRVTEYVLPKFDVRSTDFHKVWFESKPNPSLTWNLKIIGDAFVDMAKKHVLFSEDKSILELGPGYGRILSSIIKKNISFKYYTGIDLSPNNLKNLKKKFSNKNIDFVQGAFSEISLNRKYDILLSSLTLKHQYPTFFESLKNISQYLNKESTLLFDLIENSKEKTDKIEINSLLEKGPAQVNIGMDDGAMNTYVANYTRMEITEILKKIHLKLIDFDYVTHHEKYGPRLVVIARK